MPTIARKPDSTRKRLSPAQASRSAHKPTAKARPSRSAQFVPGEIAVRKFDVATFCKRYSIKRDLVSRMTSYAPRTVAAWAAGEPLKGAAIQKVTELQRLTTALEQLVEPASIGPWLQTPNPAFEGSTPAQLVERGESDRLWRMIHLLESGQQG